jgi:antitoxin (DNA-binding transcriptional repressor) of toxin-antitoxin stability system
MLLLEKQESDNLITMKRMTATEVARNFSAVLDEVENGEEIEITRGNKTVAVLRFQPRHTAGKLLESIRKRHAEFGPMDDETYEAFQAVLAERHAPYNLVGGELDRDPWAK